MTPSRAAWFVTGAYLIISVVLTWPLVLGLGRDVAWDLGDSLLNMWILAWDAEQLLAILGGDLSRIRTFFDANIFHPAPLTLAYSEHLVAQAVQILPVYFLTRNPILCYNLLFVSTFVLCGLGTFLLVRELTGPSTSLGTGPSTSLRASHAAAFLAGLLFAFAPYRFAQASHLQVLSVQWMPFVLYGFRRYFETGHRRALAGGTAALVAQNLSCGYYLLYFAPLAGLYVAWEIATRHLAHATVSYVGPNFSSGKEQYVGPNFSSGVTRRTWLDLTVAAACVIVCTLPFLLPYKELRDTLDLSRDETEIVRFSADVQSYFTAFASNRAWGDTIRAFPKPEGELFPGVVPMVLAMFAFAALILDTSSFRLEARAPHGGVKAMIAILAAIALAHGSLALLAIYTRRIDFDLVLFEIRATNITRLLVIALVAGAAALILSPRGRSQFMRALRRPEAIFMALAVLAWWLSLGPSPRVYGRPLELFAPYGVLLDHVPGYDGVRVPARLAMIVALSCAVLGGLVVARIRRRTWIVAGTLAVLFLAESHALPLLVNGVSPLSGFATPEARVHRPERAPAIYHDLALAPPDTVLLEMPFGEPDYDARAVYYSTVHWKKLVNGYSGFFPPHYSRLAAVLHATGREDDIAWRALEAFGVTHVIVHEGAYLDDEGARFSEWLRAHGAAEVSRRGRDVMFELPH